MKERDRERARERDKERGNDRQTERERRELKCALSLISTSSGIRKTNYYLQLDFLLLNQEM